MLQSILFPMLAGFAVFLLGMKAMEMALHRLAGPYLDSIIRRSTDTPLRGAAVGTVTTAFLQSSTAVTVITIGMVGSGLLSFRRSLGIILGTNVGTCLTTELIGLQIHRLGWPLLIGAAFLWFATALLDEGRGSQSGSPPGTLTHTFRYTAVAAAGFGLLLVGMTMMQSLAPAIEASPLYSWLLERAGESLWWGLAAGAILTALVHSSAAVIAMIMGLAATGAMPLELGVAVVLGANVGTCATGLLAAIGSSSAGRAVALAHVALNIGGALLFAPFIMELQWLAALLSDQPAAQIAHAQTIFNVASSLLALPLCYLPIWRDIRPKGNPPAIAP
ncbi:Na/Pi cotransporter family protein [Paenibacillus sp. 1P07SE]|uniref:Na/Pi cotransporter family protein n=1 Tax=Paenibacillus sp. 1P07SE TaxID=3132209 RepID=UPI0039A5E738